MRTIGVDAHNVLICSGIRQDVDLPTTQFNHAIVAVREPDGQYRFLDPTAEDSRQYLPYSDQFKFALVCTEKGEDIRSTPLAPPSDNRMDIRLDTTLGADGGLRTRVTLEPSGIYDLVFRNFLNSIPPARREMFFSSRMAGFLPGAVVKDLAIADLDDLNQPARMSFTLAAPDQGIRAGDYLVFTTVGQGGHLDLLLNSLLSGATTARRSYPLALAATVESRVSESLMLPPGYAVRSLPGAVELREGAASLRRTCVASSGGLDYQEQFSASELYFSGPGYQGLRRLLEQRDRLRDGKLVLVRQGGAL